MRYVTIERRKENILRVEGALDAVSAGELERVASTLIAERPASVLLDLSALQMLDSTGVAVLVSFHRRLIAHGGSLRVIGVSEQPLTVFRLLHLESHFSSGGN